MNIIRYGVNSYRYWRRGGLEVITDDYIIINDEAHSYQLMTYYIDSGNQARQLAQVGFELMEIWDRRGKRLSLEDDDSHSTWLYYVVSRMP